jgi:hypothetical protein
LIMVVRPVSSGKRLRLYSTWLNGSLFPLFHYSGRIDYRSLSRYENVTFPLGEEHER